MTVYVGETWSKYYDSSEGSWKVSKVFFDKDLADKWANQDENRMWTDYEVESPPIPIMPGTEVVDSRSLRRLNEIWGIRTEPIVQLIAELRNEYYESLCKADPKLKDYGNDFFTSRILDLINSQVFDKIGRD